MILQGAEVNEIVDTGEYFFSLLEIETSYNTLGSVSDYLDDDTFIVDARVSCVAPGQIYRVDRISRIKP